MPRVFRIGPYTVYFWANEGDPLEPVHVHISEGIPSANATKVWITRAGKCYLCNNNSISPKGCWETSWRSLKPEAGKSSKSGFPSSAAPAISAE